MNGFARVTVLIALFVALVFAGAGAGESAGVYKKPLTAAAKPAILQSMKVLTESQLTVGNFKQMRTITKLNREFVSTGSFAIDRVSGILWDTQKPFPSVLWVGDNSIVQWDPARDTKKSMSAKDNPVFAEFSKTIQSVFSGQFDELERNFKLFFDVKGAAFDIGLIPKESAVARAIASITLSGQTELDKVTIVDGEGNTVVYEFSQHRHYPDLQSVKAPFEEIANRFQKLKGK